MYDLHMSKEMCDSHSSLLQEALSIVVADSVCVFLELMARRDPLGFRNTKHRAATTGSD